MVLSIFKKTDCLCNPDSEYFGDAPCESIMGQNMSPHQMVPMITIIECLFPKASGKAKIADECSNNTVCREVEGFGTAQVSVHQVLVLFLFYFLKNMFPYSYTAGTIIPKKAAQ